MHIAAVVGTKEPLIMQLLAHDSMQLLRFGDRRVALGRHAAAAPSFLLTRRAAVPAAFSALHRIVTHYKLTLLTNEVEKVIFLLHFHFKVVHVILVNLHARMVNLLVGWHPILVRRQQT